MSQQLHSKSMFRIPLFLCAAFVSQSAAHAEHRALVLITGAPGTAEFGEQFSAWTNQIAAAAKQNDVHIAQVGMGEKENDKGQTDHATIRAALESKDILAAQELWVIFIGHGTFDGRTARFNLRGPDVSAQEMSAWLKPLTMPTAIVNCASSSAPFINRLSAPHRVIVTATKSGTEQNYSRFGKYFSSVLADPVADLDKDGQTSLLEAFLLASRRTNEFYETEGRLATEHALLDDNGDKRGSRSDGYRGVRPIQTDRQKTLDGMRAHQFHLVRSQRERNLSPELRQRRDEIETRVFQLRDQRDSLTADKYFAQLETLLVELATIYEQAEKAKQPPAQPSKAAQPK